MAKQDIDFTRRDYWDQDSLLLYKEAVSRYPYCAPARLSFLLNLKVLNDPDFEEELAFTALSVPDRQRLQEEVQAVEEAATVWRERGERRMRQAARWTSAPVIQQTTVPVGRLMNVNAPATASNAAAGIEAAGVEAHGQEVDFRAVAANDPANRFGHAVMASEAARANDTATPTDDTWGEDWPARSRSARRNALRWARLEERRREALEAEAAAMAVAAAKAKAEREAAAREAAAQVLVSEAKPKRRTKSSSSTISMLLANEVKSSSKQPSRRRGGVFNPWAEVFTAKYTISDWLQEDAPPASKSAKKSSKIAKSGAKTKTTSGKSAAAKTKTKTASVKASAKAAAKSKTTAKSSSTKASAKSAAPSSAYIDPNELIDRFLSNNSDRDLAIHPDDSRDYETFNPDRGSLNEDWSMGSETLAQIYLKQGAPDKAIEIYRSLSLKFPEKNRYFAGLIREAEETKTKK